jgi:hypothetical protein
MTAHLPKKLTPEFWAMVRAHRSLGPMDAATYQDVVGCYEGRARKAYLLALHPDTNPAEHVASMTFCVNPPSMFRSNAKWIHFRDTCIVPRMQGDPDDPNWPFWLAQIERVLAWRASPLCQ